MCRASRCQHATLKMAPQKNAGGGGGGGGGGGTYADRLDNLKRVLKPYRDNNANCLRLMTRSARVNLNKHWKSLENMFTASHDGKERAQNVANERLENGENSRPRTTTVDQTSDTVDRLRHLHVDR